MRQHGADDVGQKPERCERQNSLDASVALRTQHKRGDRRDRNDRPISGQPDQDVQRLGARFDVGRQRQQTDGRNRQKRKQRDGEAVAAAQGRLKTRSADGADRRCNRLHDG